MNKVFVWVTTLAFLGCTNLEIEQTDSVFTTLSGEFTGVEAASSLESLYNSVRSQIETDGNLYTLQEISSDEALVPTRGTDWGDNGVYRVLQGHTWSPTHSNVKTVWNDQNQNVFNATAIIDSRSNPAAQQVAEAKFIRAFSMFWLIDLYGQVPFRTPDEGPDVNPSIMTRAEAFDFAVKDLNEALPDLSDSTSFDGLNKATKAAARYLLAKFYLNKFIFTGSATADSGDMAQVISLVDAIKAQGFDLQAGYFDIFKPAPDTETIFFTTSSAGNMIWNGLHYNMVVPDQSGGWNGFTTLAEFYDSFEGDPNINVPGSGQEERRGFVPTDGSHFGIGYGFLIGQQYDAGGNPLKDRQGNPLFFTKDFAGGLLVNNETTGIRVLKYNPDEGAFVNHKVVFRYADAHLMKAEAMMRSGGDPTALVNELRVLREATPIGSVTESDLLAERGRELYNEYWRRNDLIRFGKFIEPWALKEATGDPTKNLFPIPSSALITNPNLIQNEGY
ncbi:MAG TPA: RagB/SusD family nutrient uptake outer membrane protein [Pricia sp.]|nr:RagB/SusD family nutrient uptake outer membrane protein [Pricia sp.]